MAIPQLTLGSFNLTDWSGSTYGTSVIAQGTSKGAPVPIEVAVQSWLQDGSVVITQGYDNRQVTLRVKLRAPSLTAVATAEAALFAQLGKPNTLTWTPATGPAAVFDVITSSMDESPAEDGDLAEMQAFPWRTYDLRLVCAAFTRSATETVTAALPATGITTTLLDACSAATGWTGTINGGAATVTNSGGLNTVSQASATAGLYTFTMQKTFAATTTSTKLLKVDWKSSAAGGTFTATGDGVALPLVAEGPSTVAGEWTSWFYVAAASLAVTKFTLVIPGIVDLSGSVLSVSLDNVAVTDVLPSYGTGRQQLRSVSLIGSARTTGAIAVESPTTSLGQALIYAYPANGTTNGYLPSLRQDRVSGNTVTSDSTLVSGSREPLTGSGVTFQKTLSLLPRGNYILIARMASPSPDLGAITYTVSTVLGSNSVGTATTVTPNINVGTTYDFYVLGRIMLPTVDVDRFSPAKLQIQIQGSFAGTLLDEAWLYNTTIGQLTWVNCGSGTAAVGGPAKRVFMESPSIATPRPTLRIGHSADRSDAFYPVGSVKSWQTPILTLPTLNIHTVTTNATDAVVTARYRAAWHTNPSV